MKFRIFATVLILPVLTAPGGELADGSAAPNGSSIEIIINPEARVSVTFGGSLPPPASCGTTAELLVKIVNQGFVTSQLEAEFMGEAPTGAKLDFRPEPLKGVHKELRKLLITLTEPGPTDITIAFRSHNNAPDLGGRDRIHFLIACVPDRGMPPARD